MKYNNKNAEPAKEGKWVVTLTAEQCGWIKLALSDYNDHLKELRDEILKEDPEFTLFDDDIDELNYLEFDLF